MTLQKIWLASTHRVNKATTKSLQIGFQNNLVITLGLVKVPFLNRHAPQCQSKPGNPASEGQCYNVRDLCTRHLSGKLYTRKI